MTTAEAIEQNRKELIKQNTDDLLDEMNLFMLKVATAERLSHESNYRELCRKVRALMSEAKTAINEMYEYT